MNKNLLKYFVGATLLLNIALLGFMFLGKPGSPPQVPEERLVSALKFDGEQQKKFEVLRDENRRLRRASLEQIRALRVEKYKNLSAPSDSSTVAIGHAYEKLEQVTIQHFADIRALCHPDQQKVFDNLLVEIISQAGKRRME